MSRPVDAIVIEHHLGLMDGAVVAAEIRKAKPQLPIIMLVDHLELPERALKSVDAFVTKSDGTHFLWVIVHFVLSVKPMQRRERALRAQTAAHLRRTARAQGRRKSVADRSLRCSFSAGSLERHPEWAGLRYDLAPGSVPGEAFMPCLGGR